MSDLYEKTIRSKDIYNGKIVKIRVDTVRLPDGKESRREIVEHGGAVAIVPIENNKVYFVKQFRKPIEKILLEIPAGKLELGEEPEECARRELVEEIGFWPEELKLLSSFYSSPGFSNEMLYLYLARRLVKKQITYNSGEFLEVETHSLQEVLKKITSGEIEDGKTIIGILLAAHHLSGSGIKL